MDVVVAEYVDGAQVSQGGNDLGFTRLVVLVAPTFRPGNISRPLNLFYSRVSKLFSLFLGYNHEWTTFRKIAA